MAALCFCFGLISSAIAYENIALYKPTYQEYPYLGHGVDRHLVNSSNAVDGLKSNLSVWGGQCVISENEKLTATWWVNLTSILSIHHITIYYRTENKEWGPSNGMTPRFLEFSVYVSNTTNQLDGTLCFKDNNFTVNTIPAIFSTSCPMHGQYLIYYNERSSSKRYPNISYKYAFNELCEFEVFGCPAPGFYGPNCSTSCPDPHCRYCHIETGTCQGCKPGYQGHRCELECQHGYFGQGCAEKCFNTCNGCNALNGLCDKGCYPGWKGNGCENPCGNRTFGIECSQQCGKCNQTGECHHINGTCLEGCEEGFTGLTCTEAITDEPLDNVVPTAGAVVGVLAVIVVIIVGVFIFRRKRNKTTNQEKYTAFFEEDKETEHQYSNVDQPSKPPRKDSEIDNKSDSYRNPSNVEENVQTNSYYLESEDNVYINETLRDAVPVEQLESIIRQKGTTENGGFEKEYNALPSSEKHTCDVGKMPENVPKNRFKKTFPYDHSRVILGTSDGDNSDYINANYIDGTNRAKEYIATQGPKQNTVGDFWRMIWQEDVESIVMLTNIQEGETIKCHQYWPKRNKSSRFGNITVKLIEEKEYAFFVIRKLTVTKSLIKKTRMVTQFHYTAWPDHGTPEPLGLLDFHHHVLNTETSKGAPIVVHCSAGVGRTGTYIALDALYQEGKNTGKINVAEFVKKMRENRMSMVQTYEQYLTIYLALNEIFKKPLESYSSTEFCNKVEKNMKDNPGNPNHLSEEFQVLRKVRPSYAKTDYKIARQTSAGKRTDKVLPLDKYILHLCPMVPKRGCYINAIYLPSFTKAKRFIVTQYPTSDDAIDFLRMLNDHESDIVVCLDPVHDVKSIQSWLPEQSSSKNVSPFTIHCSSISRNGNGQMIEIRHDDQEDRCHSVLVEGPRNIVNPSRSNQDTSELLSLVYDVLASKTENPVSVISSDGASLCGVFIAVHNVIQQLNMDGEVDVFMAVRQLQVCRPELCDKIEEYEMIHRAVFDHIQNTSESIYSNQ